MQVLKLLEKLMKLLLVRKSVIFMSSGLTYRFDGPKYKTLYVFPEKFVLLKSSISLASEIKIQIKLL